MAPPPPLKQKSRRKPCSRGRDGCCVLPSRLLNAGNVLPHSNFDISYFVVMISWELIWNYKLYYTFLFRLITAGCGHMWSFGLMTKPSSDTLWCYRVTNFTWRQPSYHHKHNNSKINIIRQDILSYCYRKDASHLYVSRLTCLSLKE